jgi:hypothetical protein
MHNIMLFINTITVFSSSFYGKIIVQTAKIGTWAEISYNDVFDLFATTFI